MSLPPDDHVHSEWSWDAFAGSMERTCARAVKLGLPSLAFTEHADFTPWVVPAGQSVPDEWSHLVTGDTLNPPELDLDGYLECLHRCRARFPDLRILSGVELSEPHWNGHRTARLLDLGQFDRVLGSVHATPLPGGVGDLGDGYRLRPAADVMREYLAEALRMIEQSDDFEVLAHLDFPVRYWPDTAEPYDPCAFQAEYRAVLRALAGTGRALEINTRVPMPDRLVRWWYEEGGGAVTFASDAHRPDDLAHGFAEAAAMAEASGFRPGRHPIDFWRRG